MKATSIRHSALARDQISGYHMPLNLMYVWVEVGGRLHQLKHKLAVRLGEREQMLTMEELKKEA